MQISLPMFTLQRILLVGLSSFPTHYDILKRFVLVFRAPPPSLFFSVLLLMCLVLEDKLLPSAHASLHSCCSVYMKRAPLDARSSVACVVYLVVSVLAVFCSLRRCGCFGGLAAIEIGET